jgi:hypothetical protein
MSVSGSSSTSRTTGSGEPPGLKNARAKRPERVLATGQEQELEPMDALERKIVPRRRRYDRRRPRAVLGARIRIGFVVIGPLD